MTNKYVIFDMKRSLVKTLVEADNEENALELYSNGFFFKEQSIEETNTIEAKIVSSLVPVKDVPSISA